MIRYNSTYPNTGYPDRLGPSGKFVEHYTKLICLQITGYQIKYSTMLWLLELQIRRCREQCINPLTPNGPYIGRTAPLASGRCILYIYSTNIGTEYFKHGVYSPFFFLFNM